MIQYMKTLFAVLALLVFASGLGGCTVTAGCYGYRCGMPYDYGVDAKRFNSSGTERPSYRSYGPVW